MGDRPNRDPGSGNWVSSVWQRLEQSGTGMTLEAMGIHPLPADEVERLLNGEGVMDQAPMHVFADEAEFKIYGGNFMNHLPFGLNDNAEPGLLQAIGLAHPVTQRYELLYPDEFADIAGRTLSQRIEEWTQEDWDRIYGAYGRMSQLVSRSDPGVLEPDPNSAGHALVNEWFLTGKPSAGDPQQP